MSRFHADLNLTPLIDVLLVLIVIFLAALPLTQKGLDTHLPAAAQETSRQVSSERPRCATGRSSASSMQRKAPASTGSAS